MNETIEKVFEGIKTAFEERENGLSSDCYEELAALIPDTETLTQCLPRFKELLSGYKDNISETEQKAKQWDESKKMWKSRTEQVTEFIGYVLDRLNVKKVDDGNVKCSITTREILEVDDEALLALYTQDPLYIQVTTALPSFVKVKMSIDKPALKSYLMADNSLMLNNPEMVHTKESKSVSVK